MCFCFTSILLPLFWPVHLLLPLFLFSPLPLFHRSPVSSFRFTLLPAFSRIFCPFSLLFQTVFFTIFTHSFWLVSYLSHFRVIRVIPIVQIDDSSHFCYRSFDSWCMPCGQRKHSRFEIDLIEKQPETKRRKNEREMKKRTMNWPKDMAVYKKKNESEEARDEQNNCLEWRKGRLLDLNLCKRIFNSSAHFVFSAEMY